MVSSRTFLLTTRRFKAPVYRLHLDQELLTRISDEVAVWMRSNLLQLNPAKTEFLRSTTSRRLHQLPQLRTSPGRL